MNIKFNTIRINKPLLDKVIQAKREMLLSERNEYISKERKLNIQSTYNHQNLKS